MITTNRRESGEIQFQQYQPGHHQRDRHEQREKHSHVGGEPLEAHARRVPFVRFAPLVEPLDVRSAVPEESLDGKQHRDEDEATERPPVPGHPEERPDHDREERAGPVNAPRSQAPGLPASTTRFAFTTSR